MNDVFSYVIYTDDFETIISVLADEERLIKDFFIDGGREKDEYERHVTDDIPCVGASLRLR